MIIFRESVSKEWRECFAWIPTKTLEEDWVWFETIEKSYCTALGYTDKRVGWTVYRRINKCSELPEAQEITKLS